ncbi:MAG TPA: class E sortase, partial [Rubrobacter sp.]|nr:class E sortase [Rubrobacter sp.]
ATGVADGNQPESAETTLVSRDHEDETRPENDGSEDRDSGKTVEAVLPEDVLSEKQLEHQEVPKYEYWHKLSDSQPKRLVSTDSSVGTIPAVKPFNLGRDPGGPGDRTLYLTVPKLGLKRIPVFDEVSEEKLKESVVHVPVTGFPWQEGANTYIAGHRIGYPGTGSSYVFFHLDWLMEGDEILLRDAAGKDYQYRVTEKVKVSPDNVEVMEPKVGESLVSLQTCTLPDYKKRLIVHGELVRTSA